MNSTQVANFKSILRIVLIGCVILTTLVVASVILFGQLGRFELKVILSTLAATGVSLLTLTCAPQIEYYRRVAWSGIGFAGLTFVLTLCAIWIEHGHRWSAELGRYVASSWVVTLAFAYSCGLLSREITGWVVTLRKAANAISILLAVVTTLIIFDPSFLKGIEEAARIKTIGILAAVATGSALIILISSWLKK